MAEFKIDRLRFRWRDGWNSGITYVKDDIVRYGAKVYVCVVAHTADTNFYTDLNAATARWSQMMDGQNWTGDWKASTFYKVGDLVKLGSYVWKCLEGHTSNALYSEGLSGDESKWTAFAEGNNWTNTWAPLTAYRVSDIVRYGGRVYHCNVEHVSDTAANGLEIDDGFWEVVTRSADWKTDWNFNTRYKPDDIVRYGGIIYRCITGHTSATENTFYSGDFGSSISTTSATGSGEVFTATRKSTSYYVKFSNGGTDYNELDTITVLGSDLGGSTPANDLLITIQTLGMGGSVATFTVSGTAVSYDDGLERDQVKWESIIEGVDYVGSYESQVRYKKNELVKYGGSSIWICTVGHFSSSEVMDEAKFSIWMPGLGFEDIWEATVNYQPGDVVMYGGYSYKCTQTNINSAPTVADSTNNWELIVTGYNLKADWISTETYRTGDVVRSGGNLYIAVRTNTNEFPNTDEIYDGGTDTPYPWQLLVTGKKWRGPWIEYSDEENTIANFYYPGDVVTVAGTTFACIEYHLADNSAAKPTLDLESEAVGPYWVKLAQGGYTNILEYPGDIKSIGDDSNLLRVGIGNIGEVLKSKDSLPTWEAMDIIDRVYYVSIDGLDTPERGTTLATPFRTVKYACDRAALGNYYPNADYLLGANEDWLVREMFQWMQYDKTNSISPFSPSSQFDTNKTLRDAKIIVDAVRYDLTHGNNAQTVFAALAFFKSPTEFYSTEVEDQIAFFIAALEKLKELMLKAITNVAPVNNYQTLTGFTPPVNQTINLAYSVEQDSDDTITELMDIVIDALTAGSTVGIPKPIKGVNTTILIKTGVYEEILPINIPRDTALCGDELRNTTIKPAAGYEGQDMFYVNSGTGIRNMSLKGLSGTLSDMNQYLTRRPETKRVLTFDVLTLVGGTGYTNGTYSTTSSGTGTGLTVQVTATAGAVTAVSVVAPGINYEIGDVITIISGNNNATIEVLTISLQGASFVSLNPGTGPDDSSAWITTRSCYVQNVSTFGDGCVGLKVDGTLHDGGIKSVVANDFTQIISNGIGFWVVEEGKSELVSVFTYYCHIGYLAEDGGKVRATNGNNSYGDYGSVAEGVSLAETPISAEFDNRTGEATITSVYNDENQIFCFGYSHTGQDYTSATVNITGSGAGAAAAINYENTRTGGISECRIVDPFDSNLIGGRGYTSFGGNARGGDDTSILLANQTEVDTSNPIEEQRILIVEGTGRGQYAIIDSYDIDLKEVTVRRQIDGLPGWQHLLPGFPIETLLDESTKYVIEPMVDFTSPPYTANTVNLSGSGTFTAIGSGRVNNNNITIILGSGIGRKTTNGSTWTPCSGVDTVNYIDIVFTGAYFMAISSNGIVSRSTDGTSWQSIASPSDTYTGIAVQSGIVIITSATGKVYRSTNDGSSWNSTTLGVYDGSTAILSFAAGGSGLFIIGNQSGQTWESADLGLTWQSGPVIGIGRFLIKDIVYGNGRFVVSAIDNPGDGSTVGNRFFYTLANQSSVGSSTVTLWQESQLPPSASEYFLSYAQGIFVAITASGEVAYSPSGLYWFALSSVSGTFTKIGGGSSGGPLFVPLRNSSTSVVETIRYGAKPFGRAIVTSGRISAIELFEPGSGYATAPTITITDNIYTAAVRIDIRMNSGVCAQPEFTNRGTGFLNVSATISGNGFKDEYQIGKIIKIKNLSRLPSPGDNLNIVGIPDTLYRVTQLVSHTGDEPVIEATLRISPSIGVSESPEHETDLIIRQQYSQVRLTGHDFLDIGTGGFSTTDYPNLYKFGFTSGYEPQPFNEVVEAGGGRVFYTSTDQDGNFRVGEQFKVEQSTGIVTLSADFFQLEGLTELALGGVVLGGTGAVVREFSTDPTMAANSDNVVPTQKAVVSYIDSRISGGGANINVSKLRAGSIQISNALIEELGGTRIEIPVVAKINKGVAGYAAAWSYFNGGVASTGLNEGDAVNALDASNGYGQVSE